MDFDEHEVRRFLVERDGPKAAAWLVWRFRRSLHQGGAVECKIPFDAPLPPWFAYAIETLKKRPNWEVVTLTRNPGSGVQMRVFLITWKGWLKHARASRVPA